jgi:hypothetical protein
MNGSFLLSFGTDMFVRTDPDTARVREMMAGYKLHEFGDEERWADVAIYTRESKVAPVPRADGMFQN